MKKHFSQAALVAALVSVLSACGGGGGSGGAPSDGGGNGGGGASTSVNGSATKGIIAGAPVKAYEVLSSGLSAAPVGTAITDSAGEYSLTLGADYKGGPLRVVIEGGSGVTMICDIPAGCDGVAFGQPTPLATGFKLGAVVPAPAGNTVSVHITPLTDLADRLADKSGYSASSIAAANDVIRQAFSLTFDITSIKPVDIANADSVAAGSTSAQLLALLSAAILTAASEQGSGSTLEEKLTAFATAVASGGGLVVNDTDTQPIVSLQDILVAAQTVSAAAKVKAVAEGKTLDLLAADMNLSVNLSEVAAKPASDEPTVLTPVDTATKNNVDKAKALAADLRTIATAASLKEGAVVFGGQIQQAFGDQLDMITAVAGSPLGNLLQRAGYAADALGEAAQAFDQNRSLTSFVLPAVAGEHDAITVTIVPGADSNATFSIDQTIDGAVVNLAAVARLAVDVDDGSTLEGSAALDLSGSINDDTLELVIAESKVTLVNAHESVVETNGAQYNRENQLGFDKVSLSLDATVRQVAAENPVQFSGRISATIDNVSSTANLQVQGYDREEGLNQSLEKFAFSLNGAFSDTQQHSVSAQFAIQLNNPDGVAYVYKDIYRYPVDVREEGVDETESKYVGVSFAAGLTASLPGVDSQATLLLDGQRTGLRDGVATAMIGFAGKSITVAADSVTGLLTITNQDGVVISATRPAEGEDWSGELKIGDAKVATLETTRNGIVILRYADGSFESLM